MQYYWLFRQLRLIRLAWRHDPTCLTFSAADALALAHTMLVPHELSSRDERMWASVATVPLAALLGAAGPAGSGGGIAWVRDTVARMDSVQPDDQAWEEAQARCRQSHAVPSSFTARLESVRRLDPRQRRSITGVLVSASGNHAGRR